MATAADLEKYVHSKVESVLFRSYLSLKSLVRKYFVLIIEKNKHSSNNDEELYVEVRYSHIAFLCCLQRTF